MVREPTRGDEVTTVRSDERAAPALARRRSLLIITEGNPVVTRTVALADGELTLGRGSACGLVIADERLSRRHAVLHVGAEFTLTDCGSVNGTRLRGIAIPAGQAVAVSPYEPIQLGDTTLVIQEVVASAAPAAGAPASASGPIDLGQEPVLVDSAMRRLFQVATRVANAELSVLVVGETGAGKEVVVEHLHRQSPRRRGPLIRINCAALTETLVESELFGHERGAFSGADRDRLGLIEAAAGGTVMLDEVGELPLSTQAKLLRVVETHLVTRVGGTSTRAVDVRFVAATNRDLEAEVAAGRFRHDLYFRLAGATLALPPLRARPDDIEPLARRFAAAAATARGQPTPVFTTAALAALRGHAWPGNVRELRSAVERALILADGPIDAPALGLSAPPSTRPEPAGASLGGAVPLATELADLEAARILAALAQCAGNQTRAAALLGMPRRTLVKRLAELGVERPRAGRRPPR